MLVSDVIKSFSTIFYGRMAGGEGADNPNLKGLSRIFNSETNYGRANVSVT